MPLINREIINALWQRHAIVNKKPYDQKQIAEFLKGVLKRNVFGFAQVDIEVTDDLYGKFSEMPPLFVVQEILDRDIPEEMKTYKEKTGRKTVKGKKSYWVP